jgi:hypothetical protein
MLFAPQSAQTGANIITTPSQGLPASAAKRLKSVKVSDSLGSPQVREV